MMVELLLLWSYFYYKYILLEKVHNEIIIIYLYFIYKEPKKIYILYISIAKETNQKRKAYIPYGY